MGNCLQGALEDEVDESVLVDNEQNTASEPQALRHFVDFQLSSSSGPMVSYCSHTVLVQLFQLNCHF